MICRPCRTAADLGTIITQGGHSAKRYYTMVELAEELHGLCKGCDCQHAARELPDPPDDTSERILDALADAAIVAREGDILSLNVDKTGLPASITFGGQPMPYAVKQVDGPGPGSPEGVAIMGIATKANEP